jgi:hypothetical protein
VAVDQSVGIVRSRTKGHGVLMEAMTSSETLVLTKSTRRHIPDESILHSHRRENLKSYIALTVRSL